jgi:uncharacterized protein
MQFSREEVPPNTITRYTRSTVTIHGEEHAGNLIVSASRIITDWECAALESMTEAHLARLLELDPEVIILGVGAATRFPPGSVMRDVMRRGIGFEVMNDGSAVRTYNVLLSEQRDVVLGLLRDAAG